MPRQHSEQIWHIRAATKLTRWWRGGLEIPKSRPAKDYVKLRLYLFIIRSSEI